MSQATKTLTQGSYADFLTVGLAYDPTDNDDLLSDDIPISAEGTFTMRMVGSSKAIAPKINDSPLTMVSSEDGVVVVQYQWSQVDEDLDTPGKYRGEFKFSINSLPIYLPSPQTVNIIINPNQD